LANDELEFEWDPEKERTNLLKHGVSFVTAAEIFDHPIMETLDDREDYGEDRYIAFGRAEVEIYRVVYTWRSANRIRIISAKKASKYAREAYLREIYDERDQSDARSR